jgi:hypothetical protein
MVMTIEPLADVKANLSRYVDAAGSTNRSELSGSLYRHRSDAYRST